MVDKNLIRKYQAIFTDDNNLKDYKSYYLAYVNFINENRNYFDNTVLAMWGLDMLISIDPCKYIVSKPDLSLQMESQRMGKIILQKIDTIAMVIRDALWDMITVYSGIDCPRNKCDEFRYIKVQHGNGSTELVLECAGCGLILDMEGNEYNYNIATDTIFPVTQEEVENL